MLLILDTMGCGRSKQHSPKLQAEVGDGSNSKEKIAKKKKSKGEKENKDPQASGKPKTSAISKLSPVKSIVNSLKAPPPNLNGSPKQSTILIDVEYPVYKNKEMDKLSVPLNKEVKEFRGKQNIRVTHSQIAFFEMLDKKIEEGDDYYTELSDHDHSIEISTPGES